MDDIRGRQMGMAVADGAWNQVMQMLSPSGSNSEEVFCPEDVDEDGAVNTTDLLLLLSKFGEDCGPY
jgi:hypothetical protein